MSAQQEAESHTNPKTTRTRRRVANAEVVRDLIFTWLEFSSPCNLLFLLVDVLSGMAGRDALVGASVLKS